MRRNQFSLIAKAENGKPESLNRIERMTGKVVDFLKVDLLDKAQLEEVFNKKGPFECVIHFAALKAVGESCMLPLLYHRNNVAGSVNLLDVLYYNWNT
jgi:UDP-glucose 4-epimerase